MIFDVKENKKDQLRNTANILFIKITVNYLYLDKLEEVLPRPVVELQGLQVLHALQHLHPGHGVKLPVGTWTSQ